MSLTKINFSIYQWIFHTSQYCPQSFPNKLAWCGEINNDFIVLSLLTLPQSLKELV